MTKPANAKLYRLALTYRIETGGLLAAETLPAERVPAIREGALFRRLARLADADDAALVTAASRYGPLGPTGPIRVPDQAAYLWAADTAVRGNVRNLGLLRKWLAHGGTTPIPGRVAPVAHAVAIIAEADTDWTLGRLAQFITGADTPTELERATFAGRIDRLEQKFYAGLSRRAALITRDHARGDSAVTVHVQPAARARLATAAAHWRTVLDKAAEFGGISELVPPGTLGRLATEFRPYLGEGDLPLYPAESVADWRKACRELAGWTGELARPTAPTKEGRATLRALLVLRLRAVDAWPFPTDELLGTFGRALWSLWEPVTGERPPRPCSEVGCANLLPAGARSDRHLCDEHRREHDRERAARNRLKRRATDPGAR
jgi:hypothetical protein